MFLEMRVLTQYLGALINKNQIFRGRLDERAPIGRRALNRIIKVMHSRLMTLDSMKIIVKPGVRGGKTTKLVKDKWTVFCEN